MGDTPGKPVVPWYPDPPPPSSPPQEFGILINDATGSPLVTGDDSGLVLLYKRYVGLNEVGSVTLNIPAEAHNITVTACTIPASGWNDWFNRNSFNNTNHNVSLIGNILSWSLKTADWEVGSGTGPSRIMVFCYE